MGPLIAGQAHYWVSDDIATTGALFGNKIGRLIITGLIKFSTSQILDPQVRKSDGDAEGASGSLQRCMHGKVHPPPFPSDCR